MLKEHDASFTHDDDRALRDELERLQSEIRRTRDAKSAFPSERAGAEAVLEHSITRAKERRAAASGRLAALDAERQALEHRCSALDTRVEAKRKEEELLALGASRRDQDLEWDPSAKTNPGKDARLIQLVYILILIGIVSAVLSEFWRIL